MDAKTPAKDLYAKSIHDGWSPCYALSPAKEDQTTAGNGTPAKAKWAYCYFFHFYQVITYIRLLIYPDPPSSIQ